MNLRSIFIFLTTLIVFTFTANYAFAQAVKITSSGNSELGNLNGQTIYQIVGATIEFRAVVQPPPSSGTYQWTFTGSPQIVAGSSASREIKLKWMNTGSYAVSVSYNGSATVTVNVVVTAEADDVELVKRQCSDEPQMRSITSEVPTFINFRNPTNATVKVYWLNYSTPGQRILYVTLNAGQSAYIQMWMTQPWVVTDENDNCVGIYEPIRQIGRATIINVSKIEFEKILQDSEPLSLNPNAEGGRRFYPDKQNPEESAIRNQVRVKATVSQYLPNKKVYFRSFDVDDPSANTAPIDDDSGTNANTEDNNGTVGGSKAGQLDSPTSPACTRDAATNLWGCPVDVNGVAVINFTTTMNPGDNFAIAASLDPSYLSGVTTSGINLKDASMTTLPIPPEPNPSMPYALLRGARSEMLTVWRRLHLEVDSMGNVGTDNKVTGKIVAKGEMSNPNCMPLPPPAPPPTPMCYQTSYQYDISTDDGSVLDVGRFVNGLIVFDEKKFKVQFNSGVSILLKGVPPLSPKVKINARFILYDDDDYNANDGGTPDGDKNEFITRIPESFRYFSDDPAGGNYQEDGRPKNVYASAYIMPEYNWADNVRHYNQTNLPFVLNIPDSDVLAKTDENRGSILDEKDDFWIAYLLIAYQGDLPKDGDGEGGFVSGTGPPTSPTNLCDCYQAATCVGTICSIIPKGVSGSLIYQEVMQDITRSALSDFRMVVANKGTTVPHEIGHQFGLRGDNKDPANSNVVRPNATYKIMDYPRRFTEIDEYDLHPEHINILRRRVKSPGQ